MSFYNIPTDKLYKFCALLGLFLIVSCLYHRSELMAKKETKAFILDGKIKKYMYNRNRLNEEGTMVNNELSNYLMEFERMQKSGSHMIRNYWHREISKDSFQQLVMEVKLDVTLNEKRKRKIDSLLRGVNEKHELLNLEELDMETKKNLFSREKRKLENYIFFLGIGAFIGLPLSVLGFWKWFQSENSEKEGLKRKS